MLGHFHVDEIDDDDATQVAQADLAHDFAHRLEIDLQDGNDILEQDIGGRGHVETLNTYDFDEEYAQAFLDKIEDAREYLREILGIEGDEN